jgi:hypothetical protein
MKLKLRLFAVMLVLLAGVFIWQLNQILVGHGYWEWLFDKLPSLGCLLIDIAVTGLMVIFICVAAITGVSSESKVFRGFSMAIVITSTSTTFFWWIAEFGKADVTIWTFVTMICFVANASLAAILAIKPEA